MEKSLGARIFVTGRPHICADIQTCLSRREASVVLGLTRDDINIFLHARLDEDETPDAMDGSQIAEILEKILGSTISETWAAAMVLRMTSWIIG